MEKTCEFCGAPQPVVYCQADAAFLCLSCDAKVHSANALSGRHSRALVCDSCRVNPACVRCLDHLMVLCRNCETRLHEYFTGHRKQMMSSFTGCPSARHFAALCGFNVNDSDSVPGQGGQFGSESCMKLSGMDSAVKQSSSVVAAQGGFSSQQHKILSNDQQEQNNYLVKQQILELEKLQHTEGNNRSSLLHSHGKSVTSSSAYINSGKLDECLDRQSKELDYCLGNDLQSFNNPSQELKAERFPSPTSQLDHLSYSSAGEPFWQYKSPVGNTQFWSQSLQDLGVCEELGSLDDLNIPDVDVTFRNFEDLFTNDLDLTRALLEDEDVIFSNIDKGTSIEKSGNSHSKTTTEDVSATSSISIGKDTSSKNKEKTNEHTSQRLSRSVQYSPHMMSSASFSRSRLSAESSGSECLDSGQSGSFTMREVSNTMAEVRGAEAEGIYKERQKARLQWKQSQLAPRKAKSDMHKRIKGRVVSMEGYESDHTMNATKSY